MKKLLALILVPVLIGGCYYSYEETPSPSQDVSAQPSDNPESTSTPKLPTPVPPTPPPEGEPSTGGLYAQNVNVSHDGFVYRVNSVNITKDTAELPREGPIAQFLAWHTLQKGESYLLVNTTITNPFDTPYTMRPRGRVVTLDKEYAPSDPYLAMVFDQTQHPKSNFYWTYTFAAKETLTTNHLFVLQDADLEENLCFVLYDPAYLATGSTNHTYILLHIADESTLPAVPIAEDAPPPTVPTTESQSGGNAEPETTPKPGQIFQSGENVTLGDLQYRLNFAEAVTDFQGSDWYPLSEYEGIVSWMRSGAPDVEPCALMANMTITNLTDAPVKDSLYLRIASRNETGSTIRWFGEPVAYDLRNPYKQNKNYYFRVLNPGESVTVNYLYVGDVDELKSDFRMSIDPSGGGGDNARYIEFRVKE